MLAKIGMKRNWIYEGILQTGSHFAAMGFWSSDLKRIRIRVYRSAKTYALLREGCPRVFLRMPSSVSDFFLISSASARKKLLALPCLELKEAGEEKGRGFSVFSFSIIGRGRLGNVRLINRAGMLALECLIDHSRGADFSKKLAAIKKVAPRSIFAGRLAKLRRRKN